MDHFRLRKYRGPEVWARVRRAYEAGESGPSAARRFDVGLANLRKKCRLEGWSRRHQAERSDRDLPPRERFDAPEADPGADGPVDRQAALGACLDHAAAAMARGEGPAALAALRAARAYAELTGQLRDPGFEEEDTAARWRAIETICRSDAVRDQARALAETMLAEAVEDTSANSDMIYHWRAEHLGPGVAARDHARALAAGRAKYNWDEDGVLRPLRPEVGEADRRAAEAEAGGWAER